MKVTARKPEKKRDATAAIPKAGIVEIFSSFQGEGIFIGARQVFVRFADCNLCCSFCDTDFKTVTREVTPGEVVDDVSGLESAMGSHHSVSLTGGEPLLQARFISVLLTLLRDKGFKTYLETNGTLAGALARVVDHLDMISMDIKLPSSARIPGQWSRHIAFLKTAIKKDVFVKVVVNKNTVMPDFIRARDIVGDIDRHIPFVIQPQTEAGLRTFSDMARLMEYYSAARERLRNVRVIPQVHRFMGIR